MKIICKKNELIKGVNIALKAVSNKTTMPILECFLIRCENDTITFMANDMELGIETIVEGTIEEEGTIAVEARIFSEIVRRLPDNDITIQSENNQVIITCEKAKFNIGSRNIDEFPQLPSVDKKEKVSISQFSLKEIIKQTIFSVSDSDTNAMMTGELFEIRDNDFKVVSLDGHRISIRRIELKENYEHKKVIVPGKTLNDLTRIVGGDAEKNVDIYFSSNHLLFEFDQTKVVSRLIEGEYFKIEQMVSRDYQTKITVNKQVMLDCIDRATLLVKEGDKKPIVMYIDDEKMEMKMNTTVGAMDEIIEIEKEGKDIAIAFNPKFIIEALRVIDDETVDIYMMNPKAPCIIKNEEEEYIYLILPVNFSAVQ